MNKFEQLEKLKKEIVGKCKTCGGKGYHFLINDEGEVIKRCECMKEFDLAAKFLLADIPQVFWEFELSDIDKNFMKKNEAAFSTVVDYMTNLENALKKGIGLYFHSTSRLGKSSVASIILKAVVRSGHSAHFVLFRHLVDMSFRAWKDERILEEKQKILAKDFLVFDEIEKVPITSGGESYSHVDSLIRERFFMNKPLIVTSNVILDELDKVYDESIQGMFQEKMVPVTFVGRPHSDKISLSLEEELVKE